MQRERADATWSITGTAALCAVAGFTARVDIERPELGLSTIAAGAQSLVGFHLLGAKATRGAGRVADAYQRGSDLIATYEDADDATMRYQLYWRVRAEGDSHSPRVVIDLEASAQTPLLDAHPEIWTVTRGIPGGKISQAPSISCWKFEAPITLVEMIHPADAGESRIERDQSGWTLGHRLFGSALEKGVILRSRVRAIIAPAGAAPEIVNSWFDEFADAPLPLTT